MARLDIRRLAAATTVAGTMAFATVAGTTGDEESAGVSTALAEVSPAAVTASDAAAVAAVRTEQRAGRDRAEGALAAAKAADTKRKASEARRAALARKAALAKRTAEQRQAAARRTSQGGSSPAATGGSPRAVAQALLPSYGWSTSSFGCLDSLWMRESGWRVTASNPSSGAYGIPQALPGSKMASAGPSWRSDARTQIRWGLG